MNENLNNQMNEENLPQAESVKKKNKVLHILSIVLAVVVVVTVIGGLGDALGDIGALLGIVIGVIVLAIYRKRGLK